MGAAPLERGRRACPQPAGWATGRRPIGYHPGSLVRESIGAIDRISRDLAHAACRDGRGYGIGL